MAEEFIMFTPEVAAEREVTLDAFTEAVLGALKEEVSGDFGGCWV
jgi:hypothetical protein